MPITLNHQRGEAQTVQQVDFGTGDILMLRARDLDSTVENQLWLIQHEPKPKDTWDTIADPAYPVGVETDNMPIAPTVVLAFSDRDSITSLIRSLTEIFDQMPVPEGSIAHKEKATQYLTEDGFVFLDAVNKPYWVRMWGGDAWLFYWHADNSWVSLRKINQNEVFQASQARLPAEKADLYHELHKKSTDRFDGVFSTE